MANDSFAHLEVLLMSRPYVSSAALANIAAELVDQEWNLVLTLDRVRLATGAQLRRLHFTNGASSDRQARRVLSRLVKLRLLARLDRRVGGRRAGSTGYVYALDRIGQRLLGVRNPAGGRQRRPWTPGWLFFAHSLAVTETYVRLIEASRAGALDLLDWVTEPRSWRPYFGPGGARLMLKPDAAAVIGLGEYEDRWFIEADRGTESPLTIARKLDAYRAYWSSGREQARTGVFPRVLWLVPNEGRQQLLVDIAARQPAEAWQLHVVRPFDELIDAVAKGAGP